MLSDALPTAVRGDDKVPHPCGASVPYGRDHAHSSPTDFGDEAAVRVMSQTHLEESGRRIPGLAPGLRQREFDVVGLELAQQDFHGSIRVNVL
jgi:hypothetical protein